PPAQAPPAYVPPAQPPPAYVPPAQPPPTYAPPAQPPPAYAPPAQAPPGPVQVQVPPSAPPAAQVDAAAAPTALVAPGGRDAWGRPVPGAGGAGGAGQDAARPSGDQSLMPPIARGGPALAIAAAVSVGVAAPIELLWGWTAHAHGGFFWLAAIVLLAGLGGVAIWAARGWRGGAGFAAVLGLAVPFGAWGIYAAAAAPSLFGLSTTRRDMLELLSAVWLAAALAATLIAIAGLARWRQLARGSGPSALPAALTAAAAVGFALANILAQETSQGQPIGNVLGRNVTGWYIVWGIAFLALVSIPAVLAAFLLPSSGVRLAFWSGWLLFGLAWQVSDTPNNGLKAAPGLYLTWVLWIAVLAGTAIMAARRPTDTAAGSAAYG
ncbi:MAG TPA: hypothetical protein VN840_11025, partial [Streptosporangiaceae bacterium]|nr:hypothetical protein [Streptosporangiaceae bacterium]